MLSRLRHVKTSLPQYISDSTKFAAVLCLLYPTTPATGADGASSLADRTDDGSIKDLNVILTLRSSKMRSHAGDVSFPGGRQDEGEDNWTTALREANEEIGLPYSFSEPGGIIQRICEFPPYLSKNNLLVTPCIAYTPVDPYLNGWDPTRSEAEVEEIFSIKLSDIRDGQGYEGTWLEFHRLNWRLHQFFLKGLPYPFSTDEKKRVWGLTARILVDISRTAFDCTPPYEFVDEIGDSSRILKALEDGVFGQKGQKVEERAEITGEGQIQGEEEQEQPKRRKISRRGVI